VGATTVVSVSFNTRELTALLLWSLHRVLAASDLSILIVDNASTDGSTEVLLRAQAAGLCEVIANPRNIGHGPALDVGLGTDRAKAADRVWFLDSDCVVTRPDALRAPLALHPEAAIIGESHWDRWHGRARHELYSLVVARSALGHPGVAGFEDGGDPAWSLLVSAEREGLPLATFPFTAGGYVVHVGRASLAAVVAADERAHPLYAWALDHHDPHFGGVDGARERHAALVAQFRAEVGPDLDLAAALHR
jgi:glycosyltransferase involved in cell wall biosynthesis